MRIFTKAFQYGHPVGTLLFKDIPYQHFKIGVSGERRAGRQRLAEMKHCTRGKDPLRWLSGSISHRVGFFAHFPAWLIVQKVV
jgi:hypothetical protein